MLFVGPLFLYLVLPEAFAIVDGHLPVGERVGAEDPKVHSNLPPPTVWHQQ